MFGWIDWDKLKREWKTAAIAVVGIILEGYDALVMTGVIDLPSLFPIPVQPFVAPAILMLMLYLRRWKDADNV